MKYIEKLIRLTLSDLKRTSSESHMTSGTKGRSSKFYGAKARNRKRASNRNHFLSEMDREGFSWMEMGKKKKEWFPFGLLVLITRNKKKKKRW